MQNVSECCFDITEEEVVFLKSLEADMDITEPDYINDSEYLPMLVHGFDKTSWHLQSEEIWLSGHVFYGSFYNCSASLYFEDEVAVELLKDSANTSYEQLSKRDIRANALFDEIPERQWLGEDEMYLCDSESYALRWLANHINIEANEIANLLLSLRSGKSQYDVYYKKKGNSNKRRKIVVPSEKISLIQRRINSCILKKLPKSLYAFGFSGGSTREALEPHLGSSCIFSVDIRNAFPSVEYADILRLLHDEPYEKNAPRGPELSWYVSRMIADFGTYARKLIQGSPMSPRIFDLACANIDRRLSRLAKNVGGVYTRYADNIFFSTHNLQIEAKLRRAICREIRWWHNRYPQPHFFVHKLQVRKFSGNAFHALGLVIQDGKICNTREFKRKLRKALHHVNWLIENNNNMHINDLLLKAWHKLCGLISYAQKDTLPIKLLTDFEKLQQKMHEMEIFIRN
ncbi:MAG: reverse transcriptase family protein [Candidatus Moranbacteria bacterium]|nr:reverse transcriptase family protein [Candidatus Moranbacteria bacterium]